MRQDGSSPARVRTAIHTEFRAGDVRGRGKIQNVGEGGLFVGTASIPEQGEYVQVQFRSPAGDPMEVRGLVWWTTSQRHRRPGFGLRLLSANQNYRAMVRALLGRPVDG